MKTICVYCSSSRVLEEHYYTMARQTGNLLANAGNDLIYGGGNLGLMLAVAEGVKVGGGHVTGVIPEKLLELDLAWDQCDETIVTPDLRKRKAIMEERADGFIALPGGFGTFEEVLEVMALKQLQYHNKPIVILNYDGYYDHLLDMFETAIARNVIKDKYRALYHISESPENAVAYLQDYRPMDFGPINEKVSVD
jgi:cytokinin riboside 5'-monophosphate phosphoribohydrolase